MGLVLPQQDQQRNGQLIATARMAIGAKLKESYQHLQDQPLPERLSALVRELVGTEHTPPR